MVHRGPQSKVGGGGGLCVSPRSGWRCSSLQPTRWTDAPPRAQVSCALAWRQVICTMTASGGTRTPALGAATWPGPAPSCRRWCRRLLQPHGWPDPSHWRLFKEKRREKDLIKKKKKTQTAAEILYLARIARPSSIVSLAKKLCPSVGAHVQGPTSQGQVPAGWPSPGSHALSQQHPSAPWSFRKRGGRNTGRVGPGP